MTTEHIKQLAEDFANSKEIPGCSYWNGLYHGYIEGFKASESKNKYLEMIKKIQKKAVPKPF